MPLLLPKPVDPHNAGMRQTLQTLDLSVESSAKFRFIRYAIRDELHRDRLFGFSCTAENTVPIPPRPKGSPIR